MGTNEILDLIINIESAINDNDYKGYDPYDALNSKILKLPGKIPKIILIQFFKKSPINFRKLFLVPEGINPKGLGLLLTVYSNLFKITKNNLWIDRAKEVYRLLLTLKSDGYSGDCWGYNFDWQNRAFFLKKFTPTIVNSSFIGHGLLDMYEVTNDQSWVDSANNIIPFMLKDLNKSYNDKTFCFSYTPLDKTQVHNANLLGTSLIARISKINKIEDWNEEIIQSTKFTLDHQNEDGSWRYGHKKYQHWIDSFHTGFNLMSLRYINNYIDDNSIMKSVELGEEYYFDKFFLKDGLPKYYNDSIYPIDVHSPSMALRYSYFVEGVDLFSKISDWFITNMYDSKRKYFIFQINRMYRNKINYLRWGQIWALYGLSSYLLNKNHENS